MTPTEAVKKEKPWSNEEHFKALLTDYLLPMLSGTGFGETFHSDNSMALVAYEKPCSLFVKPTKDGTYRLRLIRSQSFTPKEKRLVSLFMDEFERITKADVEHYFHTLMASLPRRVIGQLLADPRLGSTLQSAIEAFEGFASQTYEGRPIVAALGITGSVGWGELHLRELWKEPFSAVLSNGFDSMYACGCDGRVFNLQFLETGKMEPFAPHRLGSIANWCTGKKIAIVLNRNGEILVFKDQKLQFAKRRGLWHYYTHEAIVTRLHTGTKPLRKAVYESCLDISFSRAGGCIAILTKEGASKIAQVLSSDDLISSKNIPRTKLLASAIKKPFHRLDRRLRQHLLALDGATVLTHDGSVLTAGAIVKVPSGSKSGGRQAAAAELSNFGLGIKISSDGPIQGFRARKHIFSI